MHRRMQTAALALALMPALASTTAVAAAQSADPAQDYPNRPVRMITGSPGSTSDIAARFVAHKLSERWRQQVVVDNRPGAGGIIGTEIGAKAAPDGYTLTVGHIGTHASAQFLFKNLAYDPVKDFAPISLMTNSGIALVVNASVPANNLRDFVAYAKSKTGGVNYASAGGGTSSQLSGELFNQMTGAKLVHIPYKGAGFALTALVSGETQAAFLSTTTASAQVKAGRLKALAVLSKSRFSAAPDIPSVVEALRLQEAKDALLAQGAEAVPMTPEEFSVFLKQEIAKWGKVIKEAGIKAQ
jgi:tripartite-type tricarboxylate transporter receptor subunit TctC